MAAIITGVYNDGMAKIDPQYILLQQMVIDLSLINRNHYLAKTDRRGNDIEHSMTVVLLCWYLYEKLQPDLDLAKILKYAVCHDFVEQYAGDVSTFASTADRAAKVKNEAAALSRIKKEHSGFPDLAETIARYELRADEESKFVWTVDKMQALIMGDMDNWRPYAEIGITYNMFINKFEDLSKNASQCGKDIFRELIEYSYSTYYDQPQKIAML